MIIRSFKMFESNSFIKEFCLSHGIAGYDVNKDGSINVGHNIGFDSEKFEGGKLPVKFGKIEGSFWIRRCELTSLEGCPKSVNNRFSFYDNQVTSFKGFPEFVGGGIICGANPIFEIFSLNQCQEFIDLLNEYDVIRDGNKVVETRLRQALKDSNSEQVDPETAEFKFENYKLI